MNKGLRTCGWLVILVLLIDWSIQRKQLKFSSTYFKTTNQKPPNHIWARSERASVRKSFEKQNGQGPEMEIGETDEQCLDERLETGDHFISKRPTKREEKRALGFGTKEMIEKMTSPSVSHRDYPFEMPKGFNLKPELNDEFKCTIESGEGVLKGKETLTSKIENFKLEIMGPKTTKRKRNLFKSVQYEKPSKNLSISLSKNDEEKMIEAPLAGKEAQEQDATICTVCFEKPPDAVFMPCGHGGICYECSIEVWKKTLECYLCRMVFLSFLCLNSSISFLNFYDGPDH